MLWVKWGVDHDVIPFVTLYTRVLFTPSRKGRKATTPREAGQRRCHTGDRNTLVLPIRRVVHACTFLALAEFVSLAAAIRTHTVITLPVCAELASGAGGLPVTDAADHGGDNSDQSAMPHRCHENYTA